MFRDTNGNVLEKFVDKYPDKKGYFELKNDSNDNPILRWKLLLSDNSKIFKSLGKIKPFKKWGRLGPRKSF